MSQGHPAFPQQQRNAFATSTKLPDRTAYTTTTNTNTQPNFSQSAFGRAQQAYPAQPQAAQYAPVANQMSMQGPSQGQGAGRASLEKENNVLAELSEEQRDECNEAVCPSPPTVCVEN
jgi:hypothetical protein